MLKQTLVLTLFGLATTAQAQTAPSSKDIARYEGLHLAAHNGDTAEIARLARSGADLNALDRRHRTPAHVAAYASHDDSLKALADAGADMNALEFQAYDIVTIAAVADDPELMSLAIDLGNDPGLTTSPYDGTALIAAAHLGHVEVVRRLIDAGAPLDHVNNLGWTALIEAVVLGDGGPDHQAVVQLLVDAGADRTIGDFDWITSLEHAQDRGFSEMVKILSE
ncbi:ankyrin repeat domain-containing protein [uncultured Ruegeria sp.]|uniref:ankyrin repeat domain-containing protein n=1 Tax=uncultured Ruegeria sp. TaxID=259304 RepID=UPI0026045033|nr:ankyrin repeat domain-containing protein [uncultured Ruegeria sp.]